MKSLVLLTSFEYSCLLCMYLSTHVLMFLYFDVPMYGDGGWDDGSVSWGMSPHRGCIPCMLTRVVGDGPQGGAPRDPVHGNRERAPNPLPRQAHHPQGCRQHQSAQSATAAAEPESGAEAKGSECEEGGAGGYDTWRWQGRKEGQVAGGGEGGGGAGGGAAECQGPTGSVGSANEREERVFDHVDAGKKKWLSPSKTPKKKPKKKKKPEPKKKTRSTCWLRGLTRVVCVCAEQLQPHGRAVFHGRRQQPPHPLQAQ